MKTALRILKYITIAIPALIIGAICLVFILSQHYSYGIDKDEVSSEYRPYHVQEEHEETQFTTVLYSNGSIGPEDIYQGGLTIYVSHPTRTRYVEHPNWIEPGMENEWIADIHIRLGSPTTTVKVKEDTLKLILKTKDGKEVPSRMVKSNIKNCNNGEFLGCKVTYGYGTDRLPRDLYEYIYIELEINGKQVIIEKEFPLHIRRSGSAADALMGV